MYSHINIWRMNPAGARHDDTAARHIAARLSEQPGFLAYTLVRTGEREVMAVTVFESRDALEAALSSVAPMVRREVDPLAAAPPERREGEVLHFLAAETAPSAAR